MYDHTLINNIKNSLKNNSVQFLLDNSKKLLCSSYEYESKHSENITTVS